MSLYAVGDIQGCAAAFAALLDEIAFDPRHDRLWLVGDLVNRGPRSVDVLRRVRDLGSAATCVLGNHDLHLLAVAAGVRKIGASDTFADVVDAPDAGELIDWLRRLPLLHHDADLNSVLVHAGIPPTWDMARARKRAKRIERLLRGPDWQTSLATMYGDTPRRWSKELSDVAKRRYTINALTRMRYCSPSGELDFEHTQAPGDQPAGLIPWFDVPARAAGDVHIVFGHWASLGLKRRSDITAIDTGCVWGRSLTAVPLAPAGPPVAVSCG
jgi:bis(5'-nucleosyl)-tetraphosphatase (symmetrical)